MLTEEHSNCFNSWEIAMHGLTEPSGPPCGKSAIKIGVMGSASTSMSTEDLHRVDELARRLGKKLAAASCVLITGELDGIRGASSQRIASTAGCRWASLRRLPPSSTPRSTRPRRAPQRSRSTLALGSKDATSLRSGVPTSCSCSLAASAPSMNSPLPTTRAKSSASSRARGA